RLLGEAALGLDLVKLPGGLVEGGLHLLLPALGRGQVVGAAGDGHAEDQRGHEEPSRDNTRSWHVSPPSGARIEKTTGASELGEPKRWQRKIAQPRPRGEMRLWTELTRKGPPRGSGGR